MFLGQRRTHGLSGSPSKVITSLSSVCVSICFALAALAAAFCLAFSRRDSRYSGVIESLSESDESESLSESESSERMSFFPVFFC